MVARLQAFAVDNDWLSGGERVLLAVSGGLDSVAMADLFYRAGFSFGMAHCNFRLRGSASDEDARFVRDLAAAYSVPFFETAFSTLELAAERKISIQVLARELRYEWLEEVRRQHGFAWIATAHHQNDSFETALYNWTKGTGLRGLLGIPRQNGHVIRPLLFATRTELEEYVAGQGLAYRLDASNLETKYSRNKIRRQVWPVLREINPGLEATLQGNFERLAEVNAIYEWALTYLHTEWTETQGEELHIAIGSLRTFPAARTLLFEWLKPYGFSPRQAEQAFSVLDHDPGAVFYSPSHRLLLDRERLIVAPLPATEQGLAVSVPAEAQTIHLTDGILEIHRKTGRPQVFPAGNEEIYLDADQLTFPLQLRHWREGDRFAPLGMGGRRQKLQDFFSNQRLSRFAKERIWLLLNGDGEIAWVVGYRLADSFKITDQTKNYLQIRFRKM